VDRLITFYIGKLLCTFPHVDYQFKEAVYHFFRRERKDFDNDDCYKMKGWSFDDALKEEIIPLNSSYSTYMHFYLEEYEKIKDLIKKLDLKKGDVKNLYNVIQEESIDLILAFGLFGQLDLGYLDGKDYEEKIKYREEVLTTYDERVEKAIESMYRILRPNGVALISNGNKVSLIESNSNPYTLEYFKNKFIEKFSIPKIYSGKERYLMICRK